MVNLKLWFVLFVAVFFVGCSDKENTIADAETSGQNGILSINLTNSNDPNAYVVTQGTSAVISVKLTNASSVAIANHPINFSADKGDVSTDARLTNSVGVTEFSVTTDESTVGIVTATISTTIDGETLSADLLFEVEQSDSTTEPGDEDEASFTISLSILNNEGVTTNRIQSDSTAQLQATLLDENNAPIIDTPVSFSSELGTLQSSSSLTNNDGVASVILATETTLGAGFVSATVEIDNVVNVAPIAFEVIAGLTVDNFNLGYFDDTETFIPDQIKTNHLTDDGSSIINAGATLGIEFSIVDEAFEKLSGSVSATFTSACVAAGKATIDSAVASVKGTFKATYKDNSCAGSAGNEDTIVATITVNSENYVISHDLVLQPEALGSIEFVSATPDSIIIRGTGGQGQQEISTLTFLVRGELGNPVEHQEVEFELTSTVGDIRLIDDSGITNSEGIVTAVVRSGTVPTAVRVNASATTSSNVSITSQSDLLSINTGLPDQDSFTLAFSETNPEARNIVGKQVIVSAYLGDSFNNPTPDGTTINFTTEGGVIEPTCQTVGGNCSVLWTSQEPFLDNHRATILAYAIGHETFIDVNGNNIMDDSDGLKANSLISNMDAVDAGLQRPDTSLSSGFIDLQDAWRDDNENNLYDSGEVYFDYDNDGVHDLGDEFFNGPQCSSETLCPETANNLIHIRRAGVLITSSSYAAVKINQVSDDGLIAQNYDSPTLDAVANIARGTAASYQLTVSDTAFQTLAVGTEILVSASEGEVLGATQVKVADTIGTNDPDGFGGIVVTFDVNNTVDEQTLAFIDVLITSPSGSETGLTFSVILE